MRKRKPTFRCQLCNKIFKTQGWSDKHMFRKHGKTIMFPFKHGGVGKSYHSGDLEQALGRMPKLSAPLSTTLEQGVSIKHCTFCPNCGTKLPTL